MNYLDARKQQYQKNKRGNYIKFIEHIHDHIRCGNALRLSAPLTAFWAITNKCNLSCSHCYNSKSNKSIYNDLSLESAKKIVDSLYEINISEIIIEGGEPLTYNYIRDIIVYIKQKDIPLTIITNGTLINTDTARMLNSTLDEYDIIQISVDGYESECDKIRGQGVYKKVIEAILQLHNCNIVVNSVVTDESIRSLDKLCKELYNIKNISSLHLSPLMKLGNGVFLKTPEALLAEQVLLQLKRKYGSWITGTTLNDKDYLKNHPQILHSMKTVKLGCCGGRSKIYIDPNGDIYPCEFYKVNGINTNIFKNNLNDIWTNNWLELSTDSMNKSIYMKKTGIYIDFCPNIGV